ncbi:hypothetical protein [Bradyrhizobium sp. 195]|uniref:hypothetical protein n=1 Tax=Bradyrhizobium sp. 195 TaxID=2782662 RepID=UPI0020019387|nr:hypothetical protein [Bradyrhizobium sp. 195]UPK28373.1 hypothetical protein IVB26_08140 [Bradyrhizobium sp. 195]
MDDKERCLVVNKHCEDQKCERISLGRHGSPGPVANSEKIYRILIAPTDMSAEQVALTAITHTETIGMSVLRDRATDDEFRSIVAGRTAQPGRSFVGVIELSCGEIRGLDSANDAEGRCFKDRHFIVVDTDMEKLPHHADVFNTMPRQNSEGKPTAKTVWRRERGRLLDLANKNIVKRASFREGRI